MAAPMRSTSSQQEAGHRARVADLRQQGPLHSSPCITSSSNSTSSSTSTSTLQQHHHQVIQQQPPTSQSSSSLNHHHHHHNHHHHHHHHHQGLSVAASTTTNNFEYDDNEWDIGIGDLIIDLDADIEKTNEGNNNNSINSNSSGGGLTPSSVTGVGGNLVPGTTTLCGDQQHHQVNALQATTVMATSANPNTSTKNAAKMAIEHSATVDKGLKMKIKRTKPGTKSSEAKHEIVKSNEQNGTTDTTDIITGGGGGGKGTSGTSGNTTTSGKHPPPNSINASGGISSLSNSSSSNSQNSNSSSSSSSANSTSGSGSGNKRSSGGHRRDKARDKHSEKQQAAAAQQQQTSAQQNSNSNSSGGNSNNNSGGNAQSNSNNNNSKVSGNNNSNNGNSANNGGSGGNNVQVVDGGLVRVSAGQVGGQRPVFPASTGPGPPSNQQQQIGGSVIGGPPPSPAAATAQGSASKPEQAKVGIGGGSARQPTPPTGDDRSSSPPPSKKIKTEIKETVDVCVGTSVGTITEPDCLGPCEPGTSVTLEGIVWHETEGGVLVVNVTWRGKTYVGTLLDCTRHDWAPPRFCDSPTSDLDTRTPKGRGKRGRSAAATTAAAAAAAAATANTPNTDQTNNNYFTETRSSAHSKLRNGGGATGPGAPKGRRGAAANGANPSATAATATAPSSPTPFAPPRVEPSNKRKSRSGEEDGVPTGGKKSKTAANATVSTSSSNSSSSSTTSCSSNALNSSPPPSPVLLECPEPNCSKKYKHINGLKYHQSHAHGSADDEDTKDVTSMSENDESSNIEAPSPATPVKSPDKSQDSPATPQKKEDLPLILRSLDATSQPDTPRSTPPSPATPQSIQDMTNSVGSPSVPLAEAASNGVAKNVVAKPSVLRYTEEFPVSNIFPGNKSQPVSGNNLTTPSPLATVRPVNVSSISSEPQQVQQHPQEVPPPQQQPQPQPPPPQQQQTFGGQLQQQQQMPSQTFTQPPTLMIPSQNQPQIQSLPSPHPPQSPKTTATNLTPFKVKPTSALMPEDKKTVKQPLPPNFNKKKSRKSPASSPDPPQTNEAPVFGMENQSGRDEVQSPAYSDISDDGAPVIENDDKSKGNDKKADSGQQMQHMPSYVYPFYGQAPYLVSSVQENKNKEPEKQQQTIEKQPIEKDNPKKDNTNNPEYQQKVLQQHYYPYGYMPSYPYNMETSYVPSINDDKMKEERGKDNPSPIDQQQTVKQNAPIPNPIQVPNPGKVKTEPNVVKDKHQNDNHQILKESIEMKNQMSYNVYSRQQVHAQREDDVRRFYAYQEQRRKEQQHQHQQQQQAQQAQQQQQQQQNEKNLSQNKVPSQSPNLKHKEKQDDKKEKDVKQEGVKPTMETQGPPPPPTSQYYIHPSYMQSPHYGPLPFDPNHVYRGIMVPGPYGSNPYLHHPQLSRYAPEDLSRPPPPTKALDMLQHHAQYYSPHKIHELQERAIKSPTPKTSVASSSPSANNPTVNSQQMSGVQQQQVVSSSQASTVASGGGKQVTGDGKESRSPPPQRHVHTHHHTHVGLGYPMYPAPYGAAVLASQQAAAVTVINPYPPK
ncbi:zinc finger protein 608 isoform X1 [Onthophagus taurus]|uniref:zinc finger protein 608 isoform X1 n=2 Tax=Onthophagus taurus TaxID=166361 RepID=UPI0039BE3DBB